MKNQIAKRTSKLLAGVVLAAMAGLTVSQANAALVIDVRLDGTAFGDSSGKAVSIAPGGTVKLDIYLRGGDTDLANGLGQISTGVMSVAGSEKSNGVAWSTTPSQTDTVVNSFGTATQNTADASNALLASIMDAAGFSSGSNTDSTGIGTADPDTDLDRVGIFGAQSPNGGWDPTYGKVPELLIGTVSFTTGAPNASAKATPWEVDLNSEITSATGAGGGTVIKGLTGSDTTTNGLGSSLAFTIGSPVHVTVGGITPEPASLGLLGIASLALVRRRRA